MAQGRGRNTQFHGCLREASEPLYGSESIQIGQIAARKFSYWSYRHSFISLSLSTIHHVIKKNSTFFAFKKCY
ncbi:hypothetical protein QT520_20575, partial [Klebsiella pneumoniae]|nr:hypothetical protein [Klebsiella pneumoniae]